MLDKAHLSQIILEVVKSLPRQFAATSESLLGILEECLAVPLVLDVERHGSCVPHIPSVDSIVRLDERPVVVLLVPGSPAFSFLPPETLS